LAGSSDPKALRTEKAKQAVEILRSDFMNGLFRLQRAGRSAEFVLAKTK
jgi:hypothetical protein